jgi:hypothetical protein
MWRCPVRIPSSENTVWQRGLPWGGVHVVRVESPAEVPGHSGAQTEAETTKAAATGIASKIESHLRKRLFRRPRGSSLRRFFDGCCNRPGCYECFVGPRCHHFAFPQAGNHLLVRFKPVVSCHEPAMSPRPREKDPAAYCTACTRFEVRRQSDSSLPLAPFSG